MSDEPCWDPFRLADRSGHAEPPRSLETLEGVGDRLRSAAFAEIQAREAFLWAAHCFTDAPEPLRGTWKALSKAEDRHLGWLIQRMGELGISVQERCVSNQLWVSLKSCRSAEEFAIYMASAEERGRKAGERFHQALEARDPVTAGIFGKIAEEEIAHIALAARFYPEAWKLYKLPSGASGPAGRSEPC